MNTPSADLGKTGDREPMEQQPPACGPRCDCHTMESSSRVRWVLGAIVLGAAIAMAARAMVKSKAVSPDKGVSGFATGVVSTSTNNAPVTVDTGAGSEISALSDLNAVASDTNAVFVLLPDRRRESGNAPMAEIQSAARMLEARGGKLGVFTLKPGVRDYERITAQVAVPGVLAMVKGRGISAISGEITESELIQAFVAASRAGGCGPSAGSGCCPR